MHCLNSSPCSLFRPAACAGQRMMLEHELLQPLLQHMRVDLRRRDVGVAQQLLHRAQVGAAIEQMAGKGMPQHVGRDPLRVEAGLLGQLLQLLAKPLAGQVALARPARQTAIWCAASAQRRPRLWPTLRYRSSAARAAWVERHQPLAPAFALDRQNAAVAREHRRGSVTSSVTRMPVA